MKSLIRFIRRIVAAGKQPELPKQDRETDEQLAALIRKVQENGTCVKGR